MSEYKKATKATWKELQSLNIDLNRALVQLDKTVDIFRNIQTSKNANENDKRICNTIIKQYVTIATETTLLYNNTKSLIDSRTGNGSKPKATVKEHEYEEYMKSLFSLDSGISNVLKFNTMLLEKLKPKAEDTNE